MSKDFKLFTIINKRVNRTSSRQTSKQVSEHPSVAKQFWDKMSEQSLITKAPNGTQEQLDLRCESKIRQTFALACLVVNTER